MTGQLFRSIRDRENENDWFIVETDKGFYELRLGGINKIESCKSNRMLLLEFREVKIIRVLTDDFTVVIELANGQCIEHSDTFIYGDGLLTFEISVVGKDVIEKDGRLEDMRPITI